jgi:hypothetical protein
MNSVRGKLGALLGVAIVAFGLAACATAPLDGSTKVTATWSPGAPDALTSEHYQLTVAAIDKRAKTDAQAALNLLRDDVSRMRTNAPDMMSAMARLYGVSNAVDAGDWEKARVGIRELQAEYGHR